MTQDRSTPLESVVESARLNHKKQVGMDAWCKRDGLPWPCPTIRLADRVEELESALHRLRVAVMRERAVDFRSAEVNSAILASDSQALSTQPHQDKT